MRKGEGEATEHETVPEEKLRGVMRHMWAVSFSRRKLLPLISQVGRRESDGGLEEVVVQVDVGVHVQVKLDVTPAGYGV